MESTSGAHDLGPLASAADACLVFDLEGRLVAVNEAGLRALGTTLDELTGRRLWELATCLTEIGFEHTLAAMRSEGPQSLLGHLRRRDGALLATDTRLWLGPYRGAPSVFALAREVRGYQGVIEERDQLVQLLEASSEVVLLFDGELRVSHANPTAAALLGFERAEDVEGLLLQELVASEQRAHVEEDVLPALERDGWDGELELRSWRDPRARTPCWVHAFAVRNARTRKRIGFALTARDVSARRSVEARRTRLLRLAENSRQVALHLLRAEDLSQAVFEILGGVARVLGVTRAYLHRFREDGRLLLRTHTWSQERGPEHGKDVVADPSQGHAWALAQLARGEPVRIEAAAALPGSVPGLHEAGESALLLVPALIHGRLESVFGFAHEHDRTWEDEEVAVLQWMVDSFATGVERRIAERERAVAQRELEEAVEREKLASRYKSEFLASMSHELRTPVNAIRGYAELLSRPHTERVRQATWIQNLRRSTEYLLGLVHDVLDLSKIEAGHMRFELEPTPLAEILGSVEDLLAASAREKCLAFSFALEGEVPESFETDPVRLKQILVNLTGNAIKFTDQGSVAVKVRRKGTRAEGFVLEVDVCDTGGGHPLAPIGELFRPYTQVHQRSGGTGLGLQISRSLARLLGGDITVASEPRKGSVFTLSLPLLGARGALRTLPPRSAQSAAALPAALRKRRVLVVDDSSENVEVLRFLLQEAGAACESAMNGQAGVERAVAAERAGQPFDAILMDMNMPILDGFEATRRLVKAGVSSPVIALTALALAGDEERCREAGCAAYVGKPIVPSVFFDTLAKHVRTPASAPGAREDERQPPTGEGALLSMAQHPRFRGLVERYVASLPDMVARIRALEQRGELEEVRTLVHRLRGTAASYGFPGVSQAAGRCEDAIRAGASRADVGRALADLLGRMTLAAAG